jgi:NaMN:DMB phosphoribosyltransferase
MVLNFLEEGAAINVLARLHHATLQVVDVGVDADLAVFLALSIAKLLVALQTWLAKRP